MIRRFLLGSVAAGAFTLFYSLLPPIPAHAQFGSGSPNCQFSYELTNRTTEQTDGITNIKVVTGTARTPAINNRQQNCNAWLMQVAVDGFTAISFELDDSQNAYTIQGGTPLAWNAFQGTVVTGSNPTVSTGSANLAVTGYYPWLSLNLASSTGVGSIYVTLYGWISPNYIAALGGGVTPTNLVLSTLTNGQLTSMTNAQLTAMTN